MTAVDRIERTLLLPASQKRVWRAVTEPAELSRWFAPECEFRLEAGSPIRLVWEDGAVSRGVIEIIDPPQRFAFRWHAKPAPYTDPLTPENSTLVTFTLETVEKGTQVTVVETGFAGLPKTVRERVLTENTSGWRAEIEDLIAYVTQRE